MKHKPVNDHNPFVTVNAAEISLQRNRGTESPAISAWLSLVGIPKYHAATAQIMIANRAAQSATIAASVLPLKFTMSLIVMATVVLMSVITKTPKKLNTAAIKTAAFADIARVATQVAIAFGASVQPLTKITPSVSNTVISSMGFAVT